MIFNKFHPMFYIYKSKSYLIFFIEVSLFSKVLSIHLILIKNPILDIIINPKSKSNPIIRNVISNCNAAGRVKILYKFPYSNNMITDK